MVHLKDERGRVSYLVQGVFLQGASGCWYCGALVLLGIYRGTRVVARGYIDLIGDSLILAICLELKFKALVRNCSLI